MRRRKKVQGSADSYRVTTLSATNRDEKSSIFPMSGDYEIGQHINPINKKGPQDIFVL